MKLTDESFNESLAARSAQCGYRGYRMQKSRRFELPFYPRCYRLSDSDLTFGQRESRENGEPTLDGLRFIVIAPRRSDNPI